MIGLLATGTLLLGVLGFLQQASQVGEDRSVVEATYRTIQLFVLEWGGLERPMPLALDVARFAAPLVAGLAAAKALLIVFRVEAERLWVRLFGRNHVVVCGQGDKGWRLSSELRKAGWRVAGVDLAEPSRPVADWAFILGDATEPEVLERAALHRARHLVTLCGDDSTNIAVARAARDIGGEHLDIHIRSSRPDLAVLLRSEALRSHTDPAPVLEFFTLEERGAHVLLEAVDETPDVVVTIGTSALTERVTIEIPRRWDGVRVETTPAGTSPGTIADSIGGVRSIVLVADGPTDDGLTAALRLVQHLKEASFGARGGTTDVFVISREARNLGGLVAPSHGPESAITLHPFDLEEVVLTPTLLTSGARESIARAVHEAYRRTAAQSTSLLPAWEDLDDVNRGASRDAADGIGALFRAVGCDLIAAPPDDDALTLLPSEVQLMAILEHDRWLSWRATRPGAADHPHLTNWFDLPADVHERNQAVIRHLPTALHDVGQRVVRLDRSLARDLHMSYVERRIAQGESVDNNSSLVAWDRLPASLQDSNRDQLAHLRVKLQALGLDLADGPGSRIELTPEQVEQMSEMEHDRWVRHRRFDGWISGSVKNPEHKTTPHLGQWSELDEGTKETDREFVRSIPDIAEALGQHIVSHDPVL